MDSTSQRLPDEYLSALTSSVQYVSSVPHSVPVEADQKRQVGHAFSALLKRRITELGIPEVHVGSMQCKQARQYIALLRELSEGPDPYSFAAEELVFAVKHYHGGGG